MTRIYVICARGQQRDLVRALQKLGVLHIEPLELYPSQKNFAPERQDLEDLLLKVRGLRDVLLAQQKPKATETLDLAAARAQVQRLEEQVRPLIAERRQLQERLDAATRLKDILEATETLVHTLDMQPGREWLVGLGGRDISPQEIAQFLQENLPGRCAVRFLALPQDRYELLVSVDAEYAPAVREYLEAKGVRPLALPAHIPTTVTLPEAIAQLRRDLAEGPARLQELDRRLAELGKTHGAELLALERALVNRIAQIDALERFGYTDYALLISGWLPQDEYEHFARTLHEGFPGVVVRKDPQPASHDEIPVALKNNAWARPYELFLSIMGVPKYGTIDPVPFVSFFFPLFFGIIIGDVGYGVVIGALALWLRRRFAPSALARQAAQIAMHCALATIFFGAIFAEFFGFILPYPHFKRGEQTNALLLFSVALGATHILLGFLLGAINALRERHGKHALAKAAAMAALVGLGLTVGVFAGGLPEALKTPSFALLAAALVVLVLSEGLMGVLELVSYVGNIISYARLMGFGLVGLKIAELINEAGEALHNVLLAVIIGVVAHAANLGLALFESTVQSARLHYVEFFQKFLEMGGRKYEPFREIET
jgi:V/A-type H+-transporting ATPase subunit I